MQASWRVGGKSRNSDPIFADTEADALQWATAERKRFDDPYFEDLVVRVEELDAALADAEEAERDRASQLTPDEYVKRVMALQEAIRTDSPEWVEGGREVAAASRAARKQDRRRRPRDAQHLLLQGDFVQIERFEEPDLGYGISFNDLAAYAFEGLVERTVEVARAFPGVTNAWHEDRELIMLSGTFDPRALEQVVREWWLECLQGELNR